jgi:hypothetical protein
MKKFIIGVLERNEPGATYQGRVYDRFLMLRPSDGTTLHVFDKGEPISSGLATGESYEVVLLAAIPGPVLVFSARSEGVQLSERRGEIIEPGWRAMEGGYRCVRPELYQRDWVLLRTSLGQLLMSPSEIGINLRAGDFLEWQEPRFDLYAVI